ALGAPVNISRARLMLQGGIDCRVRPWESTVPYLFNMVDNGEGTSFIRFRNIYFRGTPVGGGAWTNGIAVRAIDWPLTDCVFHQCWFNLSVNSTTCIYGRMFFTTISECLFEFCHRGIVANTLAKTNQIVDCQFYKMFSWWIEIDAGASASFTINGITGTNVDSGYGAPQFLKAVGTDALVVEGCNVLFGDHAVGGRAIDLTD